MFRLLLLVALALPAVFGQCQQNIGIPTLPRIQGYVRDADHKPISGAKVEMIRLHPDGSEAEVVDTKTTNSKGYFRFKRSKDEVYRVRLHVPDRKLEPMSIRQGGIAMRTGGGMMNFLFQLDKSECVGIQPTR